MNVPASNGAGPWETTTLIGRRWNRSDAFEPSGTNCPTASVFFHKLCPFSSQPVGDAAEVRHHARQVGGFGEGDHLFPFRTEQLRPSAPMVLVQMSRESRSVPTQITKPCTVRCARLFLFEYLNGASVWPYKRRFESTEGLCWCFAKFFPKKW